MSDVYGMRSETNYRYMVKDVIFLFLFAFCVQTTFFRLLQKVLCFLVVFMTNDDSILTSESVQRQIMQR